MKRAMLLILFSLASSLVWAQSNIIIFPKVVDQEAIVDLSNFEEKVILRSRITNTESKAITVRWEEDFVDSHFEWQVDISDEHFDYFLYEDRKLKMEDVPPIHLAPGASFDLVLEIYPRGRSGIGSFFFNILTTQGEVIDHVSYYLWVKDSKRNLRKRKFIKIYPNPAVGYFQINSNYEIGHIEILNLLGNKVAQHPYSVAKKYDVSRLGNGIHFVKLIDLQGNIIKTKKIIIENPRA